ncbi:TCR-alpha V segment II-24 [Triplophysa rosa]|nr:TCR-alpha V segment II-24 [Triplophysa rosa]
MKTLMMLVILVLICYECRGEEKVDQPDKQITESEGGSVTLHCKYKTASSQACLFWYIQRVNDFPKDNLRRSKYGGDNGSEFQERFQSEVKSDSVPLIIHDVDVSDSAVYYCALKPTVTKHTQPPHKN